MQVTTYRPVVALVHCEDIEEYLAGSWAVRFYDPTTNRSYEVYGETIKAAVRRARLVLTLGMTRH